ncbi:MAG: hypothetical protein HKN91_14355 [Acidimicrobiia bacterium]|nr:hypothetical protein [Acidimicrobiia bacterium]
MSGMSDRRLMALHALEYDEAHYARVRSALEAVGIDAADDIVLTLGHAVFGHPAAASKLRQLADVWSILGNARPLDQGDRIMFEIQ